MSSNDYDVINSSSSQPENNNSFSQDRKKAKFDTEKYAKLSTGRYTPINKYNFDMSVVDQWCEIRTKNHPPRRAFHNSWIYNDYLYIAGGVDIIQGKIKDMQRIKLSEEVPTWETIEMKGESFEKVSYSASVSYKDEFYIIGGELVNLEQTRAIYKYNPETNVLDKFEIKELPPIENHSAVSSDKGIYIFGGFSYGNHLNSLYVFYPDSKTVQKISGTDTYDPIKNQDYPNPRINSAICVLNESIYMFGGKTQEGHYLNDVWIYSITNNQWRKVIPKEDATIPKGRSGHTMTLFKGELYIFGGKTGNIHENNDFWKFNPKSEEFELIQDTLLEHLETTESSVEKHQSKKSFLNPISKFSARSSTQVCKSNKLIKEKQILNDKKAAQFEEYLYNCFPSSAVMSHSLIYGMDIDNHHWKKVMATLVNKSNEMSFISIIGRIPLPRDGHTANVYRDFLVVFGGDRNKFPFNDLYTFIF